LNSAAELSTARTEASLQIIKKITSKYPIDFMTVKKYSSGSAAIYKQHISLALSDMGYSLSVFGELYHDLFSSKTGWALVETKYPDTERL